MNRNQTICFKHEEIAAVAGKIASKTDDQEISDWADEITLQAERAKDDGIAMEKGLEEKRKRITELESEVEDLKAQIKSLESDVEYQQSQREQE